MMERSDADLVADSLCGRRDAFRTIVERYQTLICSIAYNATGNLSRSEDVAQETFITAWSQLQSLREPEKLRGWLCGIVRNRIHRDWRDEQREPVRTAAPLVDAHDTPAPEAMPAEQAVSREEEALLWRSLEKIPELYREPLILFYREHKSIEHVAAALELSEDAVKQRLSRGRKLLQEEVRAFVENTLRRTAPGEAFSGLVLATLPFAAGPVATAGLGAGAKGTAAAKSGMLGGILLPLMPFLGIAAGVAAQWLIIRDITTDRRLRARRFAQVVLGWTIYIGLAAGGEYMTHSLSRHFGWTDGIHFAAAATYWWLFVSGTLTLQILVLRRLPIHCLTPNTTSPERLETSMPMKAGAMACVVTGLHLALFSWLIALAWRLDDRTGAVLITVTMLLLCLASFFRCRTRNGGVVAVLQSMGGHLACVGGMILLILNLRTDVWVASRYNVSVSDAHQVLPTWIVPILSLALISWTALLMVVTKPGQDPANQAGPR